MEPFSILHRSSLSGPRMWPTNPALLACTQCHALRQTPVECIRPHVWECPHLERGSTWHQAGQSPRLEHVESSQMPKSWGRLNIHASVLCEPYMEEILNVLRQGLDLRQETPGSPGVPTTLRSVCTPFPIQSHSVPTVNPGTDIIDSISLTKKLGRVCFRAEF